MGDTPELLPRCSVFIAVSLDGYIARTDGAIDWLSAVQVEGEDYGYKAFFDSVDTVVLGRKTYDTARGFGGWPYAGKKCVVLTHRPRTPLNDETFFAGTPQALIEKLAAEGARRIYVDGGHVIQEFLAARLIDDMTISITPILLGSGIRLFAGGEGEHHLSLEATRSWPTGLTQLRYRASPAST